MTRSRVRYSLYAYLSYLEEEWSRPCRPHEKPLAGAETRRREVRPRSAAR